VFNKIKQLFSSNKPEPRKHRHMIEQCLDCGVQSGELHDLFCFKERCPFCSGQLATCDCIRTILKLSDSELKALDEYIDDSVPPLSDIMQRWKSALDKKGRIPFRAFPDDPIRAAVRGDIKAVQGFLDDGFQPNHGNEVGYTALMGAARGEALDVIRLLLAKGAKADTADLNGYTALHWAVAQTTRNPSVQLACICVLIDAGADPDSSNKDGITPLMNAAWFGCRDAVQELLRRGVDPQKRDKKGRIAKDLAVERKRTDVEQLLN
jgi:ankyrin repeat protein